jgi:hypothetical protein
LIVSGTPPEGWPDGDFDCFAKLVSGASVITSKPATRDHFKTGQRSRTQDMNCCTAPTGVPARTFLCPEPKSISPVESSSSVMLDCFWLVGTVWKTAGEAEAGNAGEQPAKE